MKKQMLLQGLCAASLLLTVACQPTSLPPGTSPSPSVSASPSPSSSGTPGSETPGGTNATPAPTPTGSPVPAPPTTVGGGSVVIDAPAGTPVVNVSQVKSISVTAERFLSGGEGSTTTLKVSLKDAAGNPVTVEGLSLVFESLDSRVFSISENGTVTALVDFGSGQIRITEPTTGATTTINLSVSNASVSSGGGGGGGGSTSSPTPTPTPSPTPSATLNLSLNYSGLGLNAFRANTTTDGAQTGSKVGMDSAGNYVVIWESAPVITGDAADYWCGSPVCTNVVSQSEREEGLVGPDGDGSGIFGQRYRADGVPIGPEFQVNTFFRDNITYEDSYDGETYFELNGQDTPDVAMNASGQFVVTWESDEQDGDQNGIFAQRYNSGGQPVGGEFRVNSITAGEQDNPSVALRNDGSFVIVWESYDDEDDTLVRYRAFDANGNPVSADVTVANSDTDEVHAAASASGEVTVAWESEGDGFTEDTILEYQRLDANSARIGTSVEVTADTGSAGSFDLGYLSNGQLVLAWEGDASAYFTIYNSANTALFPSPQQASQDSSGDVDVVSVATNNVNSFALSWESDNVTADYSVYSRAFTYTTGVLTSTSEMRVNEELGNIVMPRDNDRDTPHIAMTTSGDLVVVWEADLDHPADLIYGVFGKLLTQNGDVK